jgi:adenosylhomocysteine nucleosidase
MITRLVVAAEATEFLGILKRAEAVRRFQWVGAQFAREVFWNNHRWLLIANGPGRRLVARMLEEKGIVDEIINIGFCGALDPVLKIGEIIQDPRRLLTCDRVAVTAEEKRNLFRNTSAAAVEMECDAVQAAAERWNVPFRCVKAVSDIASEDLPLDFNRYRDGDGRFSRSRIALAAMRAPLQTVPGLLKLERNCRQAADKIGEFLADSLL